MLIIWLGLAAEEVEEVEAGVVLASAGLTLP